MAEAHVARDGRQSGAEGEEVGCSRVGSGGKAGSAQARERERELGWARLLGSWAGLVWGLGLFSIFLSLFYFYFKQSLNSNTNLNSNNTQTKTCTSMKCNTKIKPMINFKSLRNKIELNALLNTINLRKVNKAN